MKLKQVAEILENGLLQRIADKEIQDYQIHLNHAIQKIDVIVLKNNSIDKLVWSIGKVQETSS